MLVQQSLDLRRFGTTLLPELVEALVEEQYEASLEHIFGHPFWEDIRSGRCLNGLIAYLLETRHYLHAAMWRMAPACAGLSPRDELAPLLLRHLVEEADHAHYFEAALAELGLPSGVAARLRPLPTTIEWIHLMRNVSHRDPLGAAICSGLMEHSAAERGVVRRWHDHLSRSGLLPAAAAVAIYAHVAEDHELGHGGMWREAITRVGAIRTTRLATILNDVSIVAEAIYRWLSSLREGALGHALDALREEHSAGTDTPGRSVAWAFRGSPVWAASIYDQLVRTDLSVGAASVAGYAFAASDLPIATGEVTNAAKWLRASLGSTPERPMCTKDHVDSWLRAIDDHRLWAAMVEPVADFLIEGWLFENFVYLRSAPSHVSAAIAACDDPQIRNLLFRHLVEEANHAEILRVPLEKSTYLSDLDTARALPSTRAFVGWLTDIASRDWSAYCVALVFLQSTLEPGEARHGEFYKTAAAANPRAGPFLEAMRRHDTIDGALDHAGDMQHLVNVLETNGHVTTAVVERASMVAQMTWSFLDGIWETYRHGAPALAQRIGWRG